MRAKRPNDRNWFNRPREDVKMAPNPPNPLPDRGQLCGIPDWSCTQLDWYSKDSWKQNPMVQYWDNTSFLRNPLFDRVEDLTQSFPTFFVGGIWDGEIKETWGETWKVMTTQGPDFCYETYLLKNYTQKNNIPVCRLAFHTSIYPPTDDLLSEICLYFDSLNS